MIELKLNLWSTGFSCKENCRGYSKIFYEIRNLKQSDNVHEFSISFSSLLNFKMGKKNYIMYYRI